MNKQELGSLIAELQSAQADMTEDSEFDICVSDSDDNCYDVSYTVNRMDLNENCKNRDGKPYPSELCITLDDNISIDYGGIE